MKSYIYLAAISLLLSSCASNNEQQGLDYIAQIYNAKTSYSKSFDNSQGKKDIKKFNVKLSESTIIDSLTPTVTTANIALLMYQSFTAQQRENYTHVDVELVNSKRDTVAYYYPMDALQKIDKKFLSYKRFSESLLSQNYAKIDALTDKTIIGGSIAKAMRAEIEKYSKDYGPMVSYHPFGLAEEEHPKGTYYQFQGNLVFENGEHVPYFVIVLTAPKKDQIVGFKIF